MLRIATRAVLQKMMRRRSLCRRPRSSHHVSIFCLPQCHTKYGSHESTHQQALR
ncbi:uncharacterized protein DS421_11g324670 [Arachis hypogaea]|nr:uncharacterized protein DS421_11g324670 [Arachis hypogaea]